MGLSLLVNSLPELPLSFSLASLYGNLSLIYLGLLWLLLLFFIFLLGIPSTPTVRRHEHTHRVRSPERAPPEFFTVLPASIPAFLHEFG